MIDIPKCKRLVVVALLMFVVMASGQTPQQGETFMLEGYRDKAKVMRSQGRMFVDVEDLARITNGLLRFEGHGVVLTLPSAASSVGDEAANRGFSRPFMKAAIEAMASIREWGGMLMVTVQNGYPVVNSTAGNTIVAYEGHASDSVAIASAAASSDSDSRGVELLQNEFKHVQAWSDTFVTARESMSAANLTMSEGALKNDEEAQKIIRCGQFLAQMFASGTFEDDVACH
jgi:hypothetical protein